MWLWLWHSLAAVAPIGLLAWESPYAAGAALKKSTKTTTKSYKQKHFEKGIKRFFYVLLNAKTKAPLYIVL